MIWKFTIIHDGTETEIDDPPGWDSMNKTISRDAETHGMVFNFSQSNILFIEEAYWIIKEEYILNRTDGDVSLRIEWLCDNCEGYQLFYLGKLDFKSYNEKCGDDCAISIGLEASDAEILIKNRLGTSVDITNNKAYDGTTVLTDYVALGKEISLPSKALSLKAEATSTPIDGDTGYHIIGDADYDFFTTGLQDKFIIPKFNNNVITELNDFTPSPQIDYVADFEETPIFTAASIGAIDPGSSIYNVDFRYKGKIYIKWAARGFGNSSTSLEVSISKALSYGKQKTNVFTDNVILSYVDGNSVGDHSIHEHEIPFDWTWTGDLNLETGEKIWSIIPIRISWLSTEGNPFIDIAVIWDDLSYFKIHNKSLTKPSPANVYLIHETASRLFEHITDNQFKFKSSLYGRIDSEPYSFPANGCGGMRAITNGLQIRRAVLADGSNPKVFLSPKDLFDSLNAIDCIGMGIENDNVIFEPVKYFYTDEIIFVADGVSETNTTVRVDKIWNQFNFGYDKFETESANGLDAIHTKRQYRLALKNADGKLEKISKIIADGYAIEATRRKFGTTEDWRYDQNIFMLCLKPDYNVDIDNIDSPENIYDPATVVNYAITPIRNALRWFSWLVQGVRRFATTQVLFNSGEGNYVAKGKLKTGCVNESGPIAENDPLAVADFEEEDYATPFIEPEKDAFKFPMGLNEFVDIAAKKYGKIQYRRYPSEEWKYGWIDNLKFNPNDGEAEFNLITCK